MSIRNIPVAIRAHTQLKQEKEKRIFPANKDLRKPYGKRILVFDTETTTDIYMNLLFGQAFIVEGSNQAHIDGIIKEHYLFYGENLSSDDMKMIKKFADDKGAILISRQQFVDDIFLPEIWELGSACVGFNLPFDLSRIAISSRTFKKGKHKDEFELILSESKYKPTILLKPIDSKKAFISLRFPTRPKSSTKRIPFNEGRFIDLRTLVFALTNESHSLESACKLYQVKHLKTVAEEHGIIADEYLEYNFRDVEATLDLYCKAKEEFDRHPLTLEAGKAYSPATIGKKYYEAMNIFPLREIQPDFPQEVLGYAMAAYYGGRSECHYRNKPVKVFHTDITSMYPSVFVLQNLWSWVIASKFEVEESTEEIRSFLDNISIDDLFTKEFWLKVPGLVEVIPGGHLLPVRGEYSGKNGYQIGLNNLQFYQPMWYTLADIIACKIQTGKIPVILRGLRIIPGPRQESLNPIKLRGEIDVDPANDDFFKQVIELRKEVKKDKSDEGNAMQLFLKILANSTSYGVYIEMNREEYQEEKEIDVFGLTNFSQMNTQFDKNGKYYNPLIAVQITGAARLILAMMERTILDLGGNYAFCDTDSMAIIDLVNDRPEIIGRQVVDKFKRLYPYDDDSKYQGASLLEAEDYNWQRIDWTNDTDKKNVKKNEYFPLYCFMVSAKRYVLYNLIPDGRGGHEIVIRKKSDHGLGHLTSPIKGKDRNDWVNQVWKWILSQEHNLAYEEPDWFYYPAFAQLSVSKPTIYNILNRDVTKPFAERVKPFNFMLVAYPVDESPFRNNLINKYHCSLHKAVGMGFCQNKSKCKYSSKCFANLHIIPITSYDKPENYHDFTWIEKNTKESVEIAVSQTRSQSFLLEEARKQLRPILEGLSESQEYDLIIKTVEQKGHASFAESKGRIIVKSYFDFIKEYAFHPEVKYDDCEGNQCSKNTKGLLQRTTIIPTEVKHIGKETNNLQDKEEEAAFPDEMNWDDTILDYSCNEGISLKSKIDLEQWIELRKTLKEVAKPRNNWAARLNISLDYLKQLLSGRRNPSPILYDAILAKCKDDRIRIPYGKKPKPRTLESKGNIRSLTDICFTYHMSFDEIKARFHDSIFTLYGQDYITLDSKSRELLSKNRRIARQASKEAECKNLKDITVTGRRINGSNRGLEKIQLEDITHYQASREIGRSYKTLNIRTKDGSIYKVLKKENPLLFKHKLLPDASKISFEEDKKIIEKRNGYKTEYSPWYGYARNNNSYLS